MNQFGVDINRSMMYLLSVLSKVTGASQLRGADRTVCTVNPTQRSIDQTPTELIGWT